jgi:hypothetical protein
VVIAAKLQTLQKIAPFQERAIALFTKALENGTMYEEKNEFFTKSSTLITKTSYTVAETYASVASIARDAPVPAGLDEYEKFVYKKKVLDQIKEYEDNALMSYLKTMKLAEAYGIEDDYVKKTTIRLPRLLFTAGRCFDLLFQTAVYAPPFPKGISEDEKEEFRERFQEIGVKLQDQAFEFYRAILEFAKQNYAAGEYVNHAYVRLYQDFPEEAGTKNLKVADTVISAGADWKCAGELYPGWSGIEYDDASWARPSDIAWPDTVSVAGFPEKPSSFIWLEDGGGSAPRACFRKTLYVTDSVQNAQLYVVAGAKYLLYVNGKELTRQSETWAGPGSARMVDLVDILRSGKNVIAVSVMNEGRKMPYGFSSMLVLRTIRAEYLPVFPQTDAVIDRSTVDRERWMFPPLKNFSAPAAAGAGG